jgi:hypothetical protein
MAVKSSSQTYDVVEAAVYESYDGYPLPDGVKSGFDFQENELPQVLIGMRDSLIDIRGKMELDAKKELEGGEYRIASIILGQLADISELLMWVVTRRAPQGFVADGPALSEPFNSIVNSVPSRYAPEAALVYALLVSASEGMVGREFNNTVGVAVSIAARLCNTR